MGALTRAEAIAADKTVYQGKPCRHGHGCDRRVENRSCVECGRIRNRAYIKGDPEANRVRRRRERANNPAGIQARHLAYDTAHRAEAVERTRQWRLTQKAKKALLP